MSERPSEEQARFDQMWSEYAPAVLRYARRRVLPAEVDEVVAETFVVAWRRLDDVPAHPLPWLLGVARGISANVRRTARRQEDLAKRIIATTPTSPEHSGEMSDHVLAALGALPDADRELLTLLAWDGLTREQVAQALQVSRGTLAVRLHRARRRLTAQLAELGSAVQHVPNQPTTAAVPAATPAPMIGRS